MRTTEKREERGKEKERTPGASHTARYRERSKDKTNRIEKGRSPEANGR